MVLNLFRVLILFASIYPTMSSLGHDEAQALKEKGNAFYKYGELLKGTPPHLFFFLLNTTNTPQQLSNTNSPVRQTLLSPSSSSISLPRSLKRANTLSVFYLPHPQSSSVTRSLMGSCWQSSGSGEQSVNSIKGNLKRPKRPRRGLSSLSRARRSGRMPCN